MSELEEAMKRYTGPLTREEHMGEESSDARILAAEVERMRAIKRAFEQVVLHYPDIARKALESKLVGPERGPAPWWTGGGCP